MATKNVWVYVTNHPLSREENGVIFRVKNGANHLGELVVSKGGIRWKPRGKRDHHYLSWKNLDLAAQQYPKR